MWILFLINETNSNLFNSQITFLKVPFKIWSLKIKIAFFVSAVKQKSNQFKFYLNMWRFHRKIAFNFFLESIKSFFQFYVLPFLLSIYCFISLIITALDEWWNINLSCYVKLMTWIIHGSVCKVLVWLELFPPWRTRFQPRF